MRHLATTALAAAVLALSACGGDDEEEPAGGGEPATTQAEPQTDTGTQQAGAGRETFASTCGGCHTLSDAETNGQVGPNLDELQPNEQVVLNAIRTGPSSMPENLLQGAEAQEVAEYVAGAAGG